MSGPKLNDWVEKKPGEVVNILASNTAEKPTYMLEKELVWGVPFEKKLIELYAAHRHLGEVADAMGISRNTLYVWLRATGWDRRRLALTLLGDRVS